MKTALVFGGSGFVGCYLCEELASRGYTVTVADLTPPPMELGAEFVECDIMDEACISGFMDHGPNYVFNLAGFVDAEKSSEAPLAVLNANIIGTTNILEACRHNQPQRFVLASSIYACGNSGSFYGISKLASEKVVEEYQRVFGLPFTVLRYGSLYGERATADNRVYRILHQALSEGCLDLLGDGTEVREYIHCRDAARLSVDAVEDDAYANKHLVLTGMERMSQREFLEMIREILPGEVEIKAVPENHSIRYRTTPYALGATVARKLAANPFVDLGQGLVECIAHIQADIEKGETDPS